MKPVWKVHGDSFVVQEDLSNSLTILRNKEPSHEQAIRIIVPRDPAAFSLLADGRIRATADDADANSKSKTALVDYVRPLVGTQGEGNTYPGPTTPFGMVQLGPDTDKVLWDTASGYEYSDPTILGFSMTHLSGTGIPDLGDFLFMPQVGPPELTSGDKKNPKAGYQSLYSHGDESVSLGYYRVKLFKSGVNVELAAADRAGLFRMTFPESDQASILTDLSHVLSGGAWKVVWSRVRVEARPAPTPSTRSPAFTSSTVGDPIDTSISRRNTRALRRFHYL